MRGSLCAVVLLLLLGGLSAVRAADDTPIPLPTIPTRTFSVTDYGAVGDGATSNTAALRKAVAACAAAGGGTVVVPPGRFLTGPFALASHLELRVERGATLVLSDNPKDWQLRDNRFENGIVADTAQDVAITGGGTIDGQGAFWWKNYVLPKSAPPNTPPLAHRPYLLVLNRCSRVLVRDVTLTDSPSFHLVPAQCRDVTIENVRIVAPAKSPNTDGIDPSGTHFHITGCTFDVGDDCIALKPAGTPFAEGHPACEGFLIDHCTFRHGHGLSIGGQTPSGLRHLVVQNCTFDGTETGIRMKANRGSGGLVEDASYERLTMRDVATPILITSYYPKIPADAGADPAQTVTGKTPIWRHIAISDLTATGASVAGRIVGLAEMPVSDVTLTRVAIHARKGFEIVHAHGVHFVASTVSVEQGKPLATASDADISGDISGRDGAAKEPPTASNAMRVDPQGDAPRTIQAALDAIPRSSKTPVTITISPGTYAESLHIGRDSPPITLRGDGANRQAVVITSGDQSPTLTADDTDLRVENLTLENTAGATAGPNQALMTQGDRQIFDHVSFRGWQDTVWIRAEATRACFRHCDIWGSVDFIYGGGTALFEYCDIVERRATGGVIAAPSTPQDHPFGLVFWDCHLINATGGVANTTLGRPWRPYGAATFLHCTLDAHIKPEGWRVWDGREKTCRFAEYDTRRAADNTPADLSSRVPWAHTLTAGEAAAYTAPKVFGDWNPALAR